MPTLGVQVVVIQKNEVLLTLREDVPLWCLPGGRVEPNESVAQTAVREVYEETGIQIELTRLVGVYSRPDWGNGGDHGLVFTARPIGGTPRPLDGEALEVRYFPVHALPEQLFWWHRQRIEDAFYGKTAVAQNQSVHWPFGNMTADQLRAAKRQNKMPIPMQDLMLQFIKNGEEQREVE